MADTVIGRSIVIDGEVSGDGDLVIQGTVKGRVTLEQTLVVEATGVVEAIVEARNARVSGQVTGNIVASEKVEIASGGRATGDIKAPRIIIADGAVFRGNVDTDV